MMFSRKFYRADGVFIAVWARGRILVVRHSYKPGTGIPGGGMKRSEDPITSALRELGEEVGHPIREAAADAGVRLLRTSKQWNNRGLHHFLHTELRFEPLIKIDQREIIHAEFVDPSQIDRTKCDRYFATYLDMMVSKLKAVA